MTDLTEARKALEKLENALARKRFGVFESATRLERYIPAILQCLQAAEQAQALREPGDLPKVSAW